jgi:PRTRC genetic system protein B
MNLELKHLWGVYQTPGTTQTHLLSHQVRTASDGTLTVGEAKAPRLATLQQFLQQVLERQLADTQGNVQKPLRCTGLLPARFLYFNADTTCPQALWFMPSCKRMLYFTENLQIPDGEAWLPPMLFAVNGKSLRVLALQENVVPTETTPCYVPPFSNTSKLGVCQGSAVLRRDKLDTVEGFMSAYEAMYFNSRFSHALTSTDTHIKGGNVNALWTQQIETGRRFPVKRLLPADITVGDVLATLQKGGLR